MERLPLAEIVYTGVLDNGHVHAAWEWPMIHGFLMGEPGGSVAADRADPVNSLCMGAVILAAWGSDTVVASSACVHDDGTPYRASVQVDRWGGEASFRHRVHIATDGVATVNGAWEERPVTGSLLAHLTNSLQLGSEPIMVAEAMRSLSAHGGRMFRKEGSLQ